MSRAAAVYRQSQGDEDSVSLELQREKVHELAAQHADDVIEFDLGNHTGFSLHMKPDADERIDNHPKVKSLLDLMENGEIDVLAAWDDTRLARDQYYWRFEEAAQRGGCRLQYVEPPPDDRTTFRVMRAVESEVKVKEIKKSQQAVERRLTDGADHGRPPFGLRYDDAKRNWVPDPDEWPTVEDVLTLYDSDDELGYGRVAQRIDDTNVTKQKVGKIVRNRERYDPFIEGTRNQ
jgi:DNA invertase Pin-like site-specific DNA recombinase